MRFFIFIYNLNPGPEMVVFFQAGDIFKGYLCRYIYVVLELEATGSGSESRTAQLDAESRYLLWLAAFHGLAGYMKRIACGVLT